MPTEITKAFKCDHCGKIYARKYNCVNHEAHCKKNPKNMHPCWQCAHLRKTTRTDDAENGWERIEKMGFLCAKKGIEMYSYRAEGKYFFHDITADAERMPTKCEDEETATGPPIWDSPDGVIEY